MAIVTPPPRLPLLPLRGLIPRSPPLPSFMLSGESGLEPTSFAEGSIVDETRVESNTETSDELKSPRLEERKESMRVGAIPNLVVQGKSGCDAAVSRVVCGDTMVVVDNQDLCCAVDVDFARGRSGERAGMMGGEEWDAAVIGGEVMIALSKGFATRPERGPATTLPPPRPELCTAGDCLSSI